MKKWRRIIIALLLLIIIGLGALSGVGYWLSRSAPSYYHPVTRKPQEQNALFNTGLQKYLQAQESMKKAYAAERRASYAQRNGQLEPATEPIEAVEVVFTEDELNAFMGQWASEYHDKIDAYLKDPVVVLQEGQIIIAGQLKKPELVMAVHLDASVDEKGQLRLVIASVRGGRLPLPSSFYAGEKQKASDALMGWLPAWQKEAQLSDDGAVNSAAIKAAMSKLILHLFNNEPALPYVFFPDPSGGSPKTVPVQMVDVKVTDKKLRLMLQPVDPSSRQTLIEHIRDPYVKDAPE